MEENSYLSNFINMFETLPDNFTSINTDQDNKIIELIFYPKNENNALVKLYVIELMLDSPEKTVSEKIYKPDGTFQEITYINYDKHKKPVSIKNYTFGVNSTDIESETAMLDYATVVCDLQIKKYNENCELQEEDFDPYSQINEGDIVHNAFEGVVYTFGEPSSKKTVEEINNNTRNLINPLN